jgi:hypothetical protein
VRRASGRRQEGRRSAAEGPVVGTVKGNVCGEINGKNSFGAYGGFARFFVEGETGEAALDPKDGIEAAAFGYRWVANCVG